MTVDISAVRTADLAPVADTAALKQAFSCFPTGVVAVSCLTDNEQVGMAASAFTTVSLDPPLVSLCVQNTSTTWPRLRQAPAIGVSVFSHEQSALCQQMAGPAAHRFDGIEPLRTDDGALLLPEAAAGLSCTVYNEIPAGDHALVLLKIESLTSDPSVEPLVFHASTFRALQVRARDADSAGQPGR